MLSIEKYRELLGDSKLSDEEIAEFRRELQKFIGTFLDDYFKDALRDEDEL